MPKRIVLFILLFFFFSVQANATTLSNLIRSMPVNSWATLATDGDGSGFSFSNLLQSGGYTIFNWSDKGAWDPVNKKVWYRGGGHLQTEKLISYDDATNTWSLVQNFNNAGSFHHSYGVNTINPTTRRLYFRNYGTSTTVQQANIDSYGGYSSLSANNLVQNPICCIALEYFPERNELLWINGVEFDPPAAHVYAYRFSSGTWANVGSNLTFGCYDTFAVYNPVRKEVLFGGGDDSPANCGASGYNGRAINIYDQNGTVTRKADAPIQMGIDFTVSTVDPVSGKYLFLNQDQSLRIYDAGTDTWSTATGTGVPPAAMFTAQAPPNFDIIAIPISTYGAVMFITAEPGAGAAAARIYKYTDDFTNRCAQPGVVRCFGFDTTSDFPTCSGGANGCYGFDYGIIPPSGTSDYTKATRDTSQAASGASSLMFTIPSNSPSDMAGSWHTNFSSNYLTQFGGGETFFVQWRQRFSPCLLFPGTSDSNCLTNEPTARQFQLTAGSGGWKLLSLSAGDNAGDPVGSCVPIDIPVQNTAQRGFPQVYHSCVDYWPFETNFDNPNIPGGGSDDIYISQNQRTNPFCSYQHDPLIPGTYFHDGYYPPGGGNCFRFYPNEWMTFQIGIVLGARQSGTCAAFAGSSVPSTCYKNSRIRLWVARQADTSQTLVMDYTRDLWATDPSGEPNHHEFGKVWLLPYHTNKSAAESHPQMFTWYDELVISTNFIAAPGTIIQPAGTAPSAPTGFKVSNP